MTDREVKILKLLIEKKGEVVRKEDILTTLWGDNSFYTARSLDVFIAKIRKYLKEDISAEIQTIRGDGFRLLITNAPSES
ncbi:helix-turn-helix domain-containing protein [Massilibacteroides sp.]|uniref:helix-turn-helix domain-containing protein n=1 Tax=Massilibacteroides sp. TaxID=2034766 RepID=UPI00261F8035|nr:helix-turn-helix domain-containing protein [Massilibacteroides sp.]MDD4516195.1 helix-turn-helix domain-containing protein [Massilibacteroides sp.]